MTEATGQQARVLIAVLCGLPGSGKTSLCEGLARVAVQHGVKAHHLCLDALLRQGYAVPRAGLKSDSGSNSCQTAASAAPAVQAGQQQGAAPQHGQLPFTAEAWQASRQRLLQETQLLLQQHKEQQQQQQQRMLLLVDDINHYRSMRYGFVQLARTYGAAFLQFYIECPVELALQRNSQRQGADVIPAAVVAQLAAAFEAPQPDKHHWEAAATLTVRCGSGTSSSVSQLTISQGCPQLPADDCGLQDTAATAATEDVASLADAVWVQLCAAWGPPLAPPPSEEQLAARRAAGSAANAASALHALDLGSRSLLHSMLAACGQDKRAAAAAALNAHRKQLLERLRRQQQPGAGAGGLDVQQLLSDFQQLCAEYT
uniref:AAA+ ATPase domain-containing protein n=1 Tax=Tetradesmus obliquus TaxID=3088 RepID=A0A383W9S7_TETOB|eukprot:jgi/Sobl393_1/2859/SZX73993.1